MIIAQIVTILSILANNNVLLASSPGPSQCMWEWPGDESHPILFVLHYFLQVSWLHNAGKEVVVVTSGAVAIGKLRVKQEQLLSRSVRHTLLNSVGKRGVADDLEPRACAAAGQAGLMALYETMFNQYGVGCAQVSTRGSRMKLAS
jgi:glutamate 5-kinase